MDERNKSDAAVARLLRLNCILEAERNALFDALTSLLSHLKVADAEPLGGQTVLVCGVPVEDQQFEAALRHAELVLRDESAAASARTQQARAANVARISRPAA